MPQPGGWNRFSMEVADLTGVERLRSDDGRGSEPEATTPASPAGRHDVKMTSQVLRKLQTKGLIRRDLDSADIWPRRLRVTDRGAELAVRAIALITDNLSTAVSQDETRLTSAYSALWNLRECACLT